MSILERYSPLTTFRRWWLLKSFRYVSGEYHERAEWELKEHLIRAADAIEQDQRTKAREIWQIVHTKFIDLLPDSPLALPVLLKLELFDDAEALMHQGLSRRPRALPFLEGLSEIAFKRRNWQEAVSRCQITRKRHPASLKSYWIAGASLVELARYDEADAVLVRGMRTLPEAVELFIEYAKVADRRNDLVEADRRWTKVVEDFGHIAGTLGRAAVLCKSGEFDKADETLSAILYRIGNELSVWAEYARVAEHRKDWTEAAARWGSVRKRFPLNPLGYLRCLEPLRQLGAIEQMHTILQEGIERAPDVPELRFEYAMLAHRAAQWDEAATRWSEFCEVFPGREDAARLRKEALDHMAAKVGTDRA